MEHAVIPSAILVSWLFRQVIFWGIGGSCSNTSRLEEEGPLFRLEQQSVCSGISCGGGHP